MPKSYQTSRGVRIENAVYIHKRANRNLLALRGKTVENGWERIIILSPANRALSSVGQSSGLIIRVSLVRVQQGPPQSIHRCLSAAGDFHISQSRCFIQALLICLGAGLVDGNFFQRYSRLLRPIFPKGIGLKPSSSR